MMQLQEALRVCQLKIKNEEVGVTWKANLQSVEKKMNKGQSKSVMLKVMTSEVTINLNIFGSFMKSEVVNNLNSTLVITIHQSGTRKRNSHIKK